MYEVQGIDGRYSVNVEALGELRFVNNEGEEYALKDIYPLYKKDFPNDDITYEDFVVQFIAMQVRHKSEGMSTYNMLRIASSIRKIEGGEDNDRDREGASPSLDG